MENYCDHQQNLFVSHTCDKFSKGKDAIIILLKCRWNWRCRIFQKGKTENTHQRTLNIEQEIWTIKTL